MSLGVSQQWLRILEHLMRLFICIEVSEHGLLVAAFALLRSNIKLVNTS